MVLKVLSVVLSRYFDFGPPLDQVPSIGVHYLATKLDGCRLEYRLTRCRKTVTMILGSRCNFTRVLRVVT